jgi:hypothetical protein
LCGLVGIAGKLAFKDELTMKRLLVLDFFRGPDSTGLAAIRGSGGDDQLVRIAKVPSNPLDLFDMGKFKEALNGYQSTVFLGHNRSATKGAVNHNNTHPFQVEHIVGAHNGTLETASALELEKAVGDKFSVDSQAIFACIAKHGIDATVPMLQGSWSLVWYDLHERTLNFLRNKERPMWYAFNKEFDHLFWASEWQMIDYAIKSAPAGNYEFYQEESGYRFWATEENVHYSIDIDALKAGSKERPKFKAKTLKGKEPAPVTNYAAAGHDPFMRTVGSGTQTGTTTTHTTPSTRTSRTTTSPSKTDIINLTGSPDNPFAGYFSKKHFESIAKNGCAWCNASVPYGEKGILIFERDELVLCANCSVGGCRGDPTRIMIKNFDNLL